MMLSRNCAVWAVGWLAVIAIGTGGPIMGAEPEFAAASIRPSDPDALARPRRMGPVSFDGKGTLKDWIELAFKLESFQVVGGPRWIDSDRFDINAKAEQPSSSDEIRAMLATLLKKRFALHVHSASQSMSVYAVHLGDKGAKLKASDPDTPRDGFGAIQVSSNDAVARGTTMSLLARFLTAQLQQPVLDETGLDGAYDWDFRFDEASLNQSPGTSSGPSSLI